MPTNRPPKSIDDSATPPAELPSEAVQLTGPQKDRLCEILFAAFPNENRLDQLLGKIDKLRLSFTSSSTPYRDQVMDVVTAAAGERWITTLLDAAAQLNSRDEQIADAARELRARAKKLTTAVDSTEIRQVTVMFCKIATSAELSKRPDVEEYAEFVKVTTKLLEESVSPFGGNLDKALGDEVRILFGYPVAFENNVVRAVSAALAILAKIDADSQGSTVPLPSVRIGIATGEVIVGDSVQVVGVASQIASELQNIAERNTVVVSDESRQLAGARFDFADLGARALLDQPPQRVWQVLGENENYDASDETAGESEALVGRKLEMAQLEQLWQEANSGSGQVALIVGEPGIGKSQLAREFRNSQSTSEARSLHLQCNAFAGNTPYFPITRYLARMANLAKQDDGSVKWAKLTPVLEQGGLTAEEASVIGSLLALPARSDHPSLPSLPQILKERVVTALVAFFIGLSERHPLLLIFEDAHWADQSSIDLLETLVTQLSEKRILLLILSRPEFEPPVSWQDEGNVRTIWLKRLNIEDSKRLISAVTKNKILPKTVEDEILKNGDGNPLFLEEITRSVLASKMLAEGEHEYTARADDVEIAVPPSLKTSFLARLDRMPKERETVRLASVIGRAFDKEMLQGISPLSEETLREHLHRLMEANVFSQTKVGETLRYQFRHALLREAAYSTLPRSRRRKIHSLFAQMLVDHYSELISIEPAFAAYHFRKAESYDAAADHFCKAGLAAIVRYAHIEARNDFNDALECIEELPAGIDKERWQIDTNLKLVAVSFAATNPGLNLERLAVSETQITKIVTRKPVEEKDLDRQADVWFWTGRTHHYLNDLTKAITRYEAVLADAQARGKSAAQATALGMIGRVVSVQGKFLTAQEYLEKAIPILENSGDFAEYVWAVGFLGLSLSAQGNLQRGLEVAEKGILAAAKLNYHTGMAASHILIWGVHLQGGQVAEMRVAAQKTIDLARLTGDKMYLYLGYGHLAWADMLAGNLAAAESNYRESDRLRLDLGGKAVLADWYAALAAELDIRCGSYDSGIKKAADALTLAAASGGLFATGLAHRSLAEGLARSEVTNLDAVNRHMTASLAAFSEGGALVECARTYRQWGILTRDAVTKSKYLTCARDEFGRMGLEQECADTERAFNA